MGDRNPADVLATANRLRLAREAMRPYMNQTQFAKGAGLRQNRYSQYESGDRPLTLDAAIQISNRYGISLDWLYRGDPAFMPHGLITSLDGKDSSE